MKQFKRILTLALAAALGAPAAWAAVNNTHHDMAMWRSDNTVEVCFPCHGGTDLNAVTGYGRVGALCATRCHITGGANFSNSTLPMPNRPATADDAGAAVAASPLAAAINVGLAHGLTKADLTSADNGTGLPAWDALGTALPYGTPLASGGPADMECTTCHNVHDNTQTPFLQRNLFTGGPGGTRSFCEACHAADRGNNWNGAGGTTAEAAPNGEHPVNLGLILGTVSTRTLGGRVGRFIQIDTYGATRVYDVATANGAAGLQTQAQSYVTGGKVSSWGAATTGNTFGCYTCHSAHMDSGATANLVLRDTVSANGQWNPLCLGCHGRLAPSATEGNDDNPGLSGFTHPCGPSAPTATNTTGAPAAVTFPNSTGATFTFNVNVSAIRGYPAVIGSITNGGVGMDVATFKPRCTSCHDVHGGVAGTMAIADLDGTVDGTMTGAVCYRCHMNGDLPDVTDAAGAAGEAANSHHRTSATAMATPTNAWTTADAGDPLTIDTPSWAGTAMPTGDTFGNLADGLSCPDCHVFNGTAHNW